MSLKEAKREISDKLEIPFEVVNRAYDSFWEFIRNKIQQLPLKEDLTEEEFSKLRTNFNVPSLGKLNCTYNRMVAIKAKYKEFKNKKNENNKTKKD